MSDIVFDVIDTTCQSADNSFFPPRVSMVTHSVTKIATVLGYPEYIASSPPKKYKRLTWSGTSEQQAFAVGSGDRLAHALYVYSGFGEIDTYGNQTSNYRKDYYTPCPTSNFQPSVISIPNFGLLSLRGYCWPADPNTCPVCSEPPAFKQNEATNNIFDVPTQILGNESIFSVRTSTSLTNNQPTGEVIAIQVNGPGGAQNVPETDLNGLFGCWLLIQASNNYSAVLSDEYTDAEALDRAQVINSNGSTAENLPRTTGFVSRFTSVNFDLNFANLVPGGNYSATVNFWDMVGTQTTKAYGFTAKATTHVIHDSVPTPSVGHRVVVRNPTVTFA